MADATIGNDSAVPEVDPAVLDAAEAILAGAEEEDEEDDDQEEGDFDDDFEPVDATDDDEAMASSTATPFALTNEHEFPEQARSATKSATTTTPTSSSSTPSSSPAPPALPGSPLSPYRRCPCLAVLPGRVCQFCFSSHWTKFCHRCEGSGRISLSVRQGAERSQPCGHCMGRGTLPAPPAEVERAEKEALAAAADGGAATVIATAAPEYRRAVKLPGIGVTDHKKKPLTKTAKAAAVRRNEERKMRRASAQG